jgi:2-polyprenyl-3-methyl-5-hydroxy-6-metoxy-1,4-benzoquinol methylase
LSRSRCLLCASSDFRELFRASDRLYATTSAEFPVVQCSNCGLVRMDPVPQDLSPFYPHSYWFKPSQNLAARLEETYRRLLILDHVHFVEQALRDIGSRGPVLDVGCGGGLFLAVMRQRGARVAGMDNSPEAAAAALHHNRVPALLGDLTKAPIAPASCALITMFHVLEHLPDPKAFVQAARQLLQPGGRLIVQVPNIDCWQYSLLRSNWNGVDVPRHLHDFRTSDLERLLKQSGFRVRRTKLFSWRDNPAGLATSLAPGLDPVARNVRHLDGSTPSKLFKDAIYFALVLAAIPLTALEAAFGKGSTVMMEAEPTL